MKDPHFEAMVDDYIKAVRRVKQSYIKKYGNRAKEWFGV